MVLLTFLGGMPLGAGELAPPFGLAWGGTPDRLVDWAKRFELDLLVKSPGKEPEKSIFLISPEEGSLPGNHEATMLEAHFVEGRLFEVVVHYTYPGRPADFVQEKFISLKKLLAVRHGEFKLSGRTKERSAEEGISTVSDAYHVEPAPGFLLVLARTEVEDEKRGDSSVRFSVMYHCAGVLKAQAESPVARGEQVEPLRLPERK